MKNEIFFHVKEKRRFFGGFFPENDYRKMAGKYQKRVLFSREGDFFQKWRLFSGFFL